MLWLVMFTSKPLATSGVVVNRAGDSLCLSEANIRIVLLECKPIVIRHGFRNHLAKISG